MLITNLVAEAYRMKLWPSEVYEHYVENPRDLQLLWAYSAWSAEQQRDAQKHRKKVS